MKKRLRKKLGKGEYAYPYPHTLSQTQANATMAQGIMDIMNHLGPERFLRIMQQHNESKWSGRFA